MKISVSELRARGLAPKKSFGQNFLLDPNLASRIAALATTPPGGTVVEIGAGLGALTDPLLNQAHCVVAIERDRDLCPLLREGFAEALQRGVLTLLEADAKTVDFRALFESGRPRPWVLAGNLPYQLTGPLLQRTTELAHELDAAVFMVQAEVADRLAAAPGTEDYGALTVFVGAAFEVHREIRVSSAAFAPRPAVESAVVRLVPRRPVISEETKAFRNAVRLAFAQRRKTLRNAWASLAPRDALEQRAAEAQIDLSRRGETLSVEEFARFAQRLNTDTPEASGSPPDEPVTAR